MHPDENKYLGGPTDLQAISAKGGMIHADQEPSAVADTIEQQARDIEALHNVIDQLFIKFDPILSSEPESSSEKTALQGPRGSSVIFYKLADHNDRIIYATDRLYALKRRAEV